MKLFGVAVAVLLASLPSAWAGDRATWRDLPALTPKGHPRIMTLSDETSTSKCIGKPVTPLCAVETKMACFLRGDPNLCEMSGHIRMKPEKRTDQFLRYIVTRADVIDDRHLPWPRFTDFGQLPGVPSVRAGDVRIHIREMTCLTGVTSLLSPIYDHAGMLRGQELVGHDDRKPLCGPGYDGPELYVVRKEGRQWVLMGWMPANDPFPR
jgi:hypothetical protein